MNRQVRDRKFIIMTVIKLVILALVIVLAVSLAWFNDGNTEATGGRVSTGLVKYQFNGTANELFARFFDTTDDYADEIPDIEEGTYLPATSLSIEFKAGDQLQQNGNGQYEIKSGTSIKLNKAVTNGEGGTVSTDTFTWELSYNNQGTTEAPATLTRFGRVTPIGRVGDSFSVTLTARDVTPENPRADLTFTMNFIIVEEDPGQQTQTFLPAGAQILNKPLQVYNLSTVDSKLRVLVKWEYIENGTEESTEERTQYSVDQISGSFTPFVKSGDISAPLRLSFPAATWSSKQEAAPIVLMDTNNFAWTVTKMSLTTGEYAALSGLNAASLDLKMVDAATGVFYLGAATDAADYGDIIEAADTDKNGIVSQEEKQAAMITVLEQITIEGAYSGYSTYKGFKVSVTLQARQADNYELGAGDQWFDVLDCSFDSDSVTHGSHSATP